MYHETCEPTILFLHENAGNLGLRMDYFNMLYHELSYNIIALAYRGWSESTLAQGNPNEDSLKKDALALLQYVKSLNNEKPLFVLGRSLGGAVAAYMVS